VLPKDVKALVHTLRETGVDAAILEGVEQVNASQKRVLLERVVAQYGDDLTGRRFAVWGLSFKPETDDMREAPSLTVVRGLCERGAIVSAHDPEARHEAGRYFADLIATGSLTLFEHNYDCLNGADALLVLTEWGRTAPPTSTASAPRWARRWSSTGATCGTRRAWRPWASATSRSGARRPPQRRRRPPPRPDGGRRCAS
jgi:UDP-glucose 6-dehydrogenase